MAYTYDLTTAVGQVRLLIPDNVEAAAELQDDEISFFLTERGQSVRAAAVDCCRQLARKYAKLPSFTADGLHVSNGERAQAYAARADELARSRSGGIGTASISRDDGYAQESTDSEYARRTVYIRT